jgi:hypothetical protein
MDAAVPTIEIANYADALSAGSPHRKVNTGNAVYSLRMSAKFLVRVVVTTLAHQVKIKLAEEEREGVSVVILRDFTVLGAKSDAVAGGRGGEFICSRKCRFKEPFTAHLSGG